MIRLPVAALTLLALVLGSQTDAAEVTAQQKKLYERFAEKMSNVKLVGQFTILGKEGDLPKEEYIIKSVTKTDEGDFWMFDAQIRYGGKDLPMKFPLEVKWAGTTPVITLTNLAIPGIGTFSSRVVIYKNKYAGTWTHGEVGGHLFGVIEPWKDGEAE